MLKVMFFPRPLSEKEIKELYAGKIKPVCCCRCNFWFVSRSELMWHIWEKHRR